MGARAFRSPRTAGVPQSEVVRRITRVLPENRIIDDIHPQTDGIYEAAACMRICGSRDIQTDIHTANSEEVAGDALQQTQTARGRTQVFTNK